MCECDKNTTSAVPDFTATGFEDQQTQLTTELAQLEGVQALQLKVCVGASYNSSTNKICFKVPIYGDVCITSPVAIPVSAALKACAETCGSIIPKGLKATVFLNGNAIYSGTVIGKC